MVTLEYAREAFRAFPTKATAAVYMDLAMKYAEHDRIEDDTFLDALDEIQQWLAGYAPDAPRVEVI